jgi:hypothetical protein
VSGGGDHAAANGGGHAAANGGGGRSLARGRARPRTRLGKDIGEGAAAVD